MTDPGLSRKQIEALDVALLPAVWSKDQRERIVLNDLAPVVAAMLAEARAEGRREALAAYTGNQA